MRKHHEILVTLDKPRVTTFECHICRAMVGIDPPPTYEQVLESFEIFKAEHRHTKE